MDELTKHPMMQRWWAFKSIIAALRIGFAIIVVGGMLQDCSTSNALAQDYPALKQVTMRDRPRFILGGIMKD